MAIEISDRGTEERDRNCGPFKADGRAVMVDFDDVDIMPGDEAAVIRADGSLGITEVKPFKDYEEFGGPRWALAPSQVPGFYQECFIIGRVIEAPL